MLINWVAFCFSSNLNAVPSGPWRCLVFKLWSTDEWEQRKWMNAWWMEMGRAFVAVGKRSDRRWKEEESEWMWERRGQGGGAEGDARYSASEGVLACSFFTASLIISHRHTHSQTYTHSLQCQEAEQTCVWECFQCQLIFPSNPECDSHCPGRKWKAVSISMAVSCRAVALSGACDY